MSDIITWRWRAGQSSYTKASGGEFVGTVGGKEILVVRRSPVARGEWMLHDVVTGHVLAGPAAFADQMIDAANGVRELWSR